jgi:toxin-antitoxin system PIN domain toxin
MLLDANLLLYAVHRGAEQHDAARDWLTAQLNGSRRVGIPWTSLGAFLRISTHPRAFPRPLSPATAWERVTDWLAAPVAWIPEPGPEHARVLGGLIARHDVRGNLVPDAMLAALAIEHGLTLYSTDTDFARFADVRWENPLG